MSSLLGGMLWAWIGKDRRNDKQAGRFHGRLAQIGRSVSADRCVRHGCQLQAIAPQQDGKG